MPRGPHLTLRRAGVLLAVLLVSGCGGPTVVHTEKLSDADQKSCDAFVDALPDTLSHLDREQAGTTAGAAAAYGDPPIIITCGVPEPDGFAEGAPCESVSGVDWFVPAEEYTDEPVPVTLTSAWTRPRVEVRIPDDYWPAATAAATGVLSPIVKDHLDVVGHCRA